MYVQLGKRKQGVHPLIAGIAGAAIGATAATLVDEKKRNQVGKKFGQASKQLSQKAQEWQNMINQRQQEIGDKAPMKQKTSSKTTIDRTVL